MFSHGLRRHQKLAPKCKKKSFRDMKFLKVDKPTVYNALNKFKEFIASKVRTINESLHFSR